MKAIKGRRNIFAALAVTVLFSTVLFIVLQKAAAAIACGSAAAAMLFLLHRQNQLLAAAMLICDSRILTIPSSLCTQGNKPNRKQTEETIVSTFGLLLGNKVYQWGCAGICGVRLRKAEIKKERLCLSFGADGKMLHVELLHGLSTRQSVMEIAQKMQHETGIQAEIDGW